MSDITYGPYFEFAKYCSMIKPLAELLLERVDGVYNMRLWYDPTENFIHAGFDLANMHYDVRYYKVFGITKNHMRHSLKLFSSYSHWVVDFFKTGDHLKWLTEPQNIDFKFERQLKDAAKQWGEHWGVDHIPLVWVRPTVDEPIDQWYLGSQHNEGQEWAIGIQKCEGPWYRAYRVVTKDGKLVAYTTLFTTAAQYALQEWSLMTGVLGT
jgi:hypothetical protein